MLNFLQDGNFDPERNKNIKKERIIMESQFSVCFEVSENVITEKGLENNKYAMKEIKKYALAKNKTLVRMLKNELVIHPELHHINVVKFLEVYETPVKLCILLELCDIDLFEYIEINKNLEDKEIKDYSLQILNGIEYIHDQGILHRDIKPENIFLKDKTIKIGDLGMSVKIPENDGALYEVCGTEIYMAPEVFMEIGYGKPLDIWSFGCTLYFLLSGYSPFYTGNPRSSKRLIIKGIVNFPDKVSDENKAIINFILVTDQLKRPGIKKIKEHDYFKI